MGKIISSDRVVVWVQEDGAGNPFSPFAIGAAAMGMTGKTIPGISTSPVYSRDAQGRPLLIKQNVDVPSGTPTATLSVYERGQTDILRTALQTGCPIVVQSRITECGSLIDPNAWASLDHWSGGIVGDYTMGDAPSLAFDGTDISNEASVTFDKVVQILQTSLAALTIAETVDILDIAGLAEEQCNNCGNGYPGADKMLFASAAAVALATANVWFSVNGGGVWAEITAKPFAADEDISEIDAFMLGNTQVRILAATDTTDAAAKAKFAYATVTLGNEAAATWTNILIAATATGDVIEAMEQLTFARLYLGSAGDIYVGTDQGVSDPGAAVYTGTVLINGFTISPDQSKVWAFGASNLLLLETDGNGAFVAKVGPSGGGAFTALSVAEDETIYAGNDTALFKSIDGAATANNWSSLKDFGANNSVVDIQIVKGESQLLRVYTTDSGGGGSVWESIDGGATFKQKTDITNTGYKAIYPSAINANLAFIAAAAGDIHKLSPA